ncbi:MAG: hypothetical protein IJD51_05550 [Clostridia bacterium]|nr:hypothetical protein [Clostridia bacterium]
MNMFDEARTIDGMIRMLGMTQGEIAKKLGVSQSYVGNKLRLLGYSEPLRALIVESGLTERHARAILRIKDEEGRRECVEKVRDRSLTVAECEALVEVAVEARAPSLIGRAPKNERIDCFERFITESLESLRSLGIEAIKQVGHHGRHRYITISIEDV